MNKDNNEMVCANHIDVDKDYICDTCSAILLSVENKEIESTSVSGEGSVAVSGNMPKDTTVAIEDIDKKEAISLAKQHLKYITDNDVLYAYDISLKANNNDYQPEKYNQSVNVKLSNLKLDKSKTYAMLHIKENGEKEVLSAKVLNESELEFEATSFSVYIVVYAGSHSVTFEGENYSVFDMNGDEITDGAIVTTGTKFNFIIKPNSGYGVTDLVCIDSSNQNVLINSGYISIKGGMLVGIAEDLVVQVTTVLAPQITSHPVSLKVSEGQAVTLSVSASGSGLTYLWQYRKRGEHNWSDVTRSLASGYNTNKITITATNYLSSGTEYRCVVGDANFAGNEGIKSEVAIVSITKNLEEKEIIEKIPKILKHPTMENTKVVADADKASFNIVALGNNLTFNWQYRENRESDWQSAKSLGTTTNTNEGSQSGDAITKSTFETNIVTYAMAGYEFRCVLGKTAHPNDAIIPSNAVAVIPTANEITADVKYINIDITKHPISQKIKVGDKAIYTVEASGVNTYKWQYKALGDSFWTDCDATIGKGYNTKTLEVDTSAMAINEANLEVENSFSGYEFRCAVSSSSVPKYIKTSEPAFLSVAQGDIISEEVVHSSITGKVEIIGNNLINSTLQGRVVTVDPEDCEFTYKWYYGDTTSIYEATEIEGATTTELTLTREYMDKYIFFGAIAASSNGYKLLYDVTTAEENVYDTVEYSVNLTAAKVLIDVNPKVFQYDGTAKEPEVTVTADDIVLDYGKDYTLTYSNNIQVGVATVTVVGAGPNSGEISETFMINPSELDKDEITLDTAGPTITNIKATVDDSTTITADISEPVNPDSSNGSGLKTDSVEYAITLTEQAPNYNGTEWQGSNVFNNVDADPIYLWVKAEDNLGNQTIEGGMYTKPILMGRETGDGNDSYSSDYMIGAERANLTQYTADKVKTITLLNTNEVPAGVEASWDVSTIYETYEIMAWIIPNGTLNGEKMYDLYIGAKDELILSTGNKLFADYINCTEIKNLNIIDTSKVVDMSGMFANCKALNTLDLTSFNTTNVTNMNTMFSGATNIKTLILGEEFTKINGTNMFSETSSLERIIAHNPTPMELGTAVGIGEQTTLYVLKESAYESANNYSSVFNNGERVKPIVEVLGDNPVSVNFGEIYEEVDDEGVSVAGCTGTELEELESLGYSLTTSGLPIDTTKDDPKEVTYTLNYKNPSTLPNGETTAKTLMMAKRQLEVTGIDGNYSVGGSQFYTLLEAYNYIDTQLSGVGTIKVLKSNTDNSKFIVYEGRDITIDTNGYTITKTDNVIENAGTLTIKGSGTETEGIYTEFADANTLGDLISNKGILNIEGSNLVHRGRTNLYWYTIRQLSKSTAQINMTGGSVKATFEAIEGSTAKPANSGRAFEIGTGTFTMEDGLVETVNANYGLAVTSFTSTSNASNSNAINIKGGTIKSDKENAILISSSSGYTNPCILNISGGTIESPNAINIKNTFNGLVTITGGTINGTTNVGLTNESANGRVIIGNPDDDDVAIDSPIIMGANIGVKSPNGFEFYDGILKGKSNAIYGSARDCVEAKPQGYVITTGKEGDYKTVYLTAGGYYIVDDVFFDYLEEAYTYIKEGTGKGTIKVLIGDWDKSTLNIEAGDEVTIDLNGKTVTKTTSSIINNGKLTISGNGTITTSEAMNLFENNGEMIMAGTGNLKNTSTSTYAVISNNGTFNMTSGTINGPKGINNSGKVVVGNSGDTVVNKDKPVIIGSENAYYEVQETATLELYDGILKAQTGDAIAGVSNALIDAKPTGHEVYTDVEDSYNVAYLKKAITSVELSDETFIYDGTEKTFSSVIVKYNEVVLSEDNYEISYVNNVNVGFGQITISGIGEYTGTIKKVFEISKANANLVLDKTDIFISPGESITINYTYNGRGDIIVSPADETVATIVLDKANKQITITGVSEAAISITINVQDTDEYVGDSAIINVLVEDSSAVFMTKWNIPVDVDGAAKGTTITLPIPSHISNNFEVRWGDGQTNKYTTENFVQHTYKNTEAKTYEIQIKGNVNAFGYLRTNEVTETNIYSNYYTFTKYLTGIVQWGEIGASSLGFANCTSLSGTIPNASGFENLTSVQNMFYNCIGLTGTIPTDFLGETSNLTSASGMFANCRGLTGTIEADFFNANIGIRSFENTFAGCENLTGTIPEGLFNNMTEVTSYAGTFNGCSKLTGTIPEDLFASSTRVKSFNQTFANCSGLVSGAADANGVVHAVSAKLFENQNTVNDYYRTFYNCTSLSGIIDIDLFSNNTVINSFPADEGAIGNFKGTFEGCTGITSANLNTKIVGHEMFKGCTALEEVNMNQAIDIGNQAFYGCNKLNNIEASEVYLNTIGTDAFEYTGTNPVKLFTNVNRENEALVNYNWDADNRTLDIEAPKGRVEIITDKYPFTNTRDVALRITLTDDNSDATNCQIVILNEDEYKEVEDGLKSINELQWQTYIENKEWTLSEGDGIKTVYVFFRDEIGNMSKTIKNIAG